MKGRTKSRPEARAPVLVDGIAQLLLPELVRVEQGVVRQAMLLADGRHRHAVALAIAALYLERATAVYLAACDATASPPAGAAALEPEGIH